MYFRHLNSQCCNLWLVSLLQTNVLSRDMENTIQREENSSVTYIYLSSSDNWNKLSHPFKQLDFGKWEIKIAPNPDGLCAIKHLSRVKVRDTSEVHCFSLQVAKLAE